MPSSTSSFKRKLRLPRLFFAKPSEIVPRDYERPIPQVPWRGMTVIVVLVVIAVAYAWEFYCRSIGYGPTLNDNEDLWTMTRRRVQPESVVIIGDSRGWFDLDLDELQKGLGKRPVQLAMAGSCPYPVLADLTNDESFHGTIICSVTPRLFVAPPGTPPMERAKKAVRRSRTQTPAQRASQYLAMPLEEHVAFLKQEDLTLEELLKRLPIPNRPGALVPPRLPPYFRSVDRERRARMIEECARPGSELQRRIQQIWLPLFTPPPPPTYIPKEAFMAKMKEAIEARFRDTAAAVNKLRARGGKIVFVRLPASGELKALEDRTTPRSQIWDRVIKDTAAPGIYFEDFPELSGFDCPEWSHLSAGDSVEFSKRLVPHLRQALQI
jgi:transposase